MFELLVNFPTQGSWAKSQQATSTVVTFTMGPRMLNKAILHLAELNSCQSLVLLAHLQSI